MKGHDFKLIISLLANHFTRSAHIISVRAGPFSTQSARLPAFEYSKVLQGPYYFPGNPVAIKYNKYQKDLRETNKNLYKDIEEHPDPDRMGPVPIATRRCQRALIDFDVPCRPVFSRSGKRPPTPHRGAQASRSQRAKVSVGDGASNSKRLLDSK